MMKTNPPLPTDAELEILALLWENGWSTVNDVHSHLGPRRNIGYTTVLKLMQIMFNKGLVQRDESRRKHLYSAVQPPEVIRSAILSAFIARAFNGSVVELIRQALALGPVSPDDRNILRALIEPPANSPHPGPADPDH